MAAYRRGGSLTGVQTKRGCSMKCIYCTYPILEGRTLRIRPAARVGDELEHLAETYGVAEVFFTDNVFNNGSTQTVNQPPAPSATAIVQWPTPAPPND